MKKNRIKELEHFFLPGSEWLYIKIYTGPKTSDVLLSTILDKFMRNLVHDKLILKWFFIRYSDPGHHLRIRFHLHDPKYSGQILEELAKQFYGYYSDGLIWDVKVETYVRELSRYGQSSIDIFENLFYYNSLMVLDYFTKETILNTPRWLFSLIYIDYFLTLCEFDLDTKFSLMNEMSLSFGSEFNVSGNYKKPINYKYKENKTQIESSLSNSKNTIDNQIFDLIRSYQKEEKLLIEAILKEDHQIHSSIDRNLQLRSYIHMFMNRLFTSKNRKYELVCYDFISRYYRSQIARNKKATKFI